MLGTEGEMGVKGKLTSYKAIDVALGFGYFDAI